MSNERRPPLVTCTPFALVLALLAAVGWFAWDPYVARFVAPAKPAATASADAKPVAPRGDFAPDEQATIDLFEKSSPSVVHIRTSRLARNRFSMSAMEYPLGSGSGYVWDDRGFVVTNAHVIANATRARVTLADGTESDAKLVGQALEYDIAVLQIEAPGEKLPSLRIGASKDLRVGQKVYAIGNPFGLDHTLTTGIISALGREIAGANRVKLKGMIQTDAAINPGNSGGPLFDSSGRLIGMNTAIYTETGSNVGIGFALPVDVINAIVPQIIKQGTNAPPILGVLEAAPQVKAMLRASGVVIESVEPGSGAEKAGLRSMEQLEDGSIRADVIVAVAGKPVATTEDIRSVLAQHAPGDKVSVELQRGRERLAVEVVLQAR